VYQLYWCASAPVLVVSCNCESR